PIRRGRAKSAASKSGRSSGAAPDISPAPSAAVDCAAVCRPPWTPGEMSLSSACGARAVGFLVGACRAVRGLQRGADLLREALHLIDKSETFVSGYSALEVLFGRTPPEAGRVPCRKLVKPAVRLRR